ncbi:MAG: CSLREA domain-containing protein, partial [Roseovarius sp.]|nr:CSLREA domain-containing protein [Roseovarius sp.]
MAIFTVTTTEDVVDANDGVTSLREAITSANGTVGADTITFSGAAFDGDAVIRLTQDEVEITDALTIDGATAGGAVVITGDANDDDVTLAGTDITDVAASGDALLDDNSRLFTLTGAGADTTFNSLTLTGGRTTGDGQAFSGGAIYSMDADVTLTNSTLSGNSTAGDNAAGGGVYANTLTLTNSTLSGNSTSGFGARGGGLSAVFGDVTLTNSTLSGNSTAGDSAQGGGAFAGGGDVTLTNSTLSGNSTAGEFAHGGGVSALDGAVTLTNSTLSGNSTAGDSADGGG